MTATSPQPVVRPATSRDLPTLGRLGALLVQEHHDFDARRLLAPRGRTPADYARFLGSQLDDPDVAVLVAENGDDVIGYAYAAIEGRQVFGVFKQAPLDCRIDQIRETPVRFGRLHAKRAVQVRIQVHGGSPGLTHGAIMDKAVS